MKNRKSQKFETTDYERIKTQYEEFIKHKPDGLVYSEVLYDPAMIKRNPKSPRDPRIPLKS